MRQWTFVLTAFVAGSQGAGASAQERPDFSGVWTVSESSGGATTSGDEPYDSPGSGWGETFTLVQTEDTLTVERAFYRPRDFQPTMTSRYPLDGSEIRNTVLMGQGMQVQVSTAAWEDNKLVITTTHTVPDVEVGRTVACEVIRTLSLQPPPLAAWSPSLVVETTRCGVLGGAPSTTRTVYGKNQVR